MTSWREIDRLRKDARAFRALASRLVTLFGDDLTDWEVAFLEGVSGRTAVEEFSTLQGEKLLQIRDDCELVEEVHGFSVVTLLRQCNDARLDLTEEDEDWIVRLKARDVRAIRRREAYRLLRCARALNIVDRVPA